jgi:phosphomethylpyrimidine synthase
VPIAGGRLFVFEGTMTQLIDAREGRITPQMHEVAAAEELPEETIRAEVAAGRVVIPSNRRRSFRAVGIGRGLTTKVNANLGTSLSHHDIGEEIEKLRVAVDAGADAVMDLSTGGDLSAIRRAILEASPVMVGTVPIYGAAARLAAAGKGVAEMDADALFDEIETQCAQGVDFITVHCGVTRAVLARLAESPRVLGIVSRGGALLARWIGARGRENPLYEQYDRLLAIARAHDVTLSLGDGLRPGSVVDAHDAAQMEELATLGVLVRRAREAGVQTMIEGPGHVPLDQVEATVKLQKRLCGDAPFYVLGPLVTDAAAGHDHVAAAIGGAIAAAAGADFLCYVTSAEHLRLPTLAEVRDGVAAARVAAHAGDLVKIGDRALARDRAMSVARRNLDWDAMFSLGLDPVTARHKRLHSEDAAREVCTMCGDLCAVRAFDEYEKERGRGPSRSTS